MKKYCFLILFCAGLTGAYSTKAQVITTIAGTGVSGYYGDGGPATTAEIYYPSSVASDPFGNIYFADFDNHRVRKINAAGIVTTVAGNGSAGFSGDGGAAIIAELNYPVAVSADQFGNLFIADYNNNRVRKVDAAGIITTIAGNGAGTYTTDGVPATVAALWQPSGVAEDVNGNIFIADYHNARIRKINSSGIISTVAGNGIPSYGGDDGPATLAKLFAPTGIALDADRNLYIADRQNNRVRKVDTFGIIRTIAGNGTPGYTGDGTAATTASLQYPISVALDAAGNIYISDNGNNVIREVSTTGIITTIAGNGTLGYGGDGGAATLAELNYPSGITVDASGNVYIPDTDNSRLRKVSPTSSVTTAISGDTAVCIGAADTLSCAATGGVWESNNAAMAAVNTSGIVNTGATGTDTIAYFVGGIVIAKIISVDTFPTVPAVTGDAYVCVGKHDTLISPALSGAWSSSGVFAIVNSAGIVTGVSAGNDTIIYALTNVCGTARARFPLRVLTTAACDSLLETPVLNNSGSGIEVYPNPNQGEFTVKVNGKFTDLSATMINMYGRVVEMKNNKPATVSTMSFETRSLTPGAYMLIVTVDGRIYREKVLITD